MTESAEIETARNVPTIADFSNICDTLFLLYTTRSKDVQDRIVNRCYAPNAVFEDNILRVSGAKNIRAQFRSFQWLFERVDVTEEGFEIGNNKTGASSVPGPTALVANSTQNYAFRTLPYGSFLLPKTVVLEVETHLIIKDKVIVHHKDAWSSITTTWRIPGLTLLGIIRRMNGCYTSLILRVAMGISSIFHKKKS